MKSCEIYFESFNFCFENKNADSTKQSELHCRGKLCAGILTINLIFIEYQFSLYMQQIRLYYLLDFKRSFLKSCDSFAVHIDGLFDRKQQRLTPIL